MQNGLPSGLYELLRGAEFGKPFPFAAAMAPQRPERVHQRTLARDNLHARAPDSIRVAEEAEAVARRLHGNAAPGMEGRGWRGTAALAHVCMRPMLNCETLRASRNRKETCP